MTDAQLRTLQRRWAETGALADWIELRAAQQRMGVLSQDEELELLALQLRVGGIKTTPYPLLHKLPEGDDRDEDLYWFLGKASFGSYKAPSMLDQVQVALVTHLVASEGSNAIVGETYDETLRRALPALPPYSTPQPWLDQAIHPDVLTDRVMAGPRPRHPVERYENQWEAEPASFSDLLHDATWFCWHHWSGDVFVSITKDVLKDHQRYNSLSLVSAMLFTIAAWSARIGTPTR